MDTWLVAHCMARLPRMTYFSHPESSLDDFFSAEASFLIYGNGRGDHDQRGCVQLRPKLGKKFICKWCRAASHELQFLESLRESLGSHSSVAEAKVDSHLCLDRFLGSDCLSAMSVERSLLLPLGDDHLFIDRSGVPRPPVAPISMSNLPMLSRPGVRVLGIPSSDHHVVSCEDINKHGSALVGVPARSEYQCNWDAAKNQPCGKKIEGGSKEMWVHVRKAHGLKGLYSGWCICRWSGCMERLKVSSMQRHLAKHLEIKWRCSSCDMVFSRYDYVRRHIKLSQICHSSGAEAVCYSGTGFDWTGYS